MTPHTWVEADPRPRKLPPAVAASTMQVAQHLLHNSKIILYYATIFRENRHIQTHNSVLI